LDFGIWKEINDSALNIFEALLEICVVLHHIFDSFFLVQLHQLKDSIGHLENAHQDCLFAHPQLYNISLVGSQVTFFRC